MNQEDTVAAAAIITAAREGKKVRRLMPEEGPIRTVLVRGVARWVCQQNSMFDYAADVETLYLWVSGMFEHAWPMREVIDDYNLGYFYID
jgi:hypothetical protein